MWVLLGKSTHYENCGGGCVARVVVGGVDAKYTGIAHVVSTLLTMSPKIAQSPRPSHSLWAVGRWRDVIRFGDDNVGWRNSVRSHVYVAVLTPSSHPGCAV